ncbi:uncharacterized protein [Procambarus clarkii]|uniref:uncharacterized protein n=1 Tax=Procambarus clarkii TaxID=6728 RepID=UPI0037434030
MIVDRVYRDLACTPLDIPENIVRKLLQACTKEAPFLSPDGHMYKQVDRVAMGSPLDVLFANFYMETIDQRVLVDMGLKPAICCRYVDDIFMQVPDVRRLRELKEAFEHNSVLSFTFEMETDGKLSFLDVAVTERNGGFHTAVYTKETNIGMCLNANSDCPDRYKRNVFNTYVDRALSHSSGWKRVDEELCRVRQVLVNNGLFNNFVEDVIKRKVNRDATFEDSTNTTLVPLIGLFYRNFFLSAHKME